MLFQILLAGARTSDAIVFVSLLDAVAVAGTFDVIVLTSLLDGVYPPRFAPIPAVKHV